MDIWRMLGCVCPIACERAPRLASLGPSPRRIPGTLPPPPELGHRGSLGAPSPRGRLRAKLTLAQPVSGDTDTSRPVARAPALPLARSGTCADPVCAPGGSTASGPHACTAEPWARKPSRVACGGARAGPLLPVV